MPHVGHNISNISFECSANVQFSNTTLHRRSLAGHPRALFRLCPESVMCFVVYTRLVRSSGNEQRSKTTVDRQDSSSGHDPAGPSPRMRALRVDSGTMPPRKFGTRGTRSIDTVYRHRPRIWTAPITTCDSTSRTLHRVTPAHAARIFPHRRSPLAYLAVRGRRRRPSHSLSLWLHVRAAARLQLHHANLFNIKAAYDGQKPCFVPGQLINLSGGARNVRLPLTTLKVYMHTNYHNKQPAHIPRLPAHSSPSHPCRSPSIRVGTSGLGVGSVTAEVLL